LFQKLTSDLPAAGPSWPSTWAILFRALLSRDKRKPEETFDIVEKTRKLGMMSKNIWRWDLKKYYNTKKMQSDVGMENTDLRSIANFACKICQMTNEIIFDTFFLLTFKLDELHLFTSEFFSFFFFSFSDLYYSPIFELDC
jgi:hypothetical protein